jgi:hypothetical protein
MGERAPSLICSETMWESTHGKMKLPPPLVNAYLNLITKKGLVSLASRPRPKEAPVGGPSQEATDEHFVHAFDGSVARTQLAYLDFAGELPTTSAILQRFLTGGDLCLTDVPCGAAAASLALLCSIAELRENNKLPRIPLNVHVIGGEISEPARIYADELLDLIRPILAAQAIFLTNEITHWDVLDEVSNTGLIEKIILSNASKGQLLVVLSNFNGFLTRSGKKEQALPQIKELFRYCSGSTNAGVWIEPDMNKAKFVLFPWLQTIIKSLSKFVQLIDSYSTEESSSVKFEIPFSPTNTATVRIRVVPMDLVRGDAT